jgi:hypothetical protein
MALALGQMIRGRAASYCVSKILKDPTVYQAKIVHSALSPASQSAELYGGPASITQWFLANIYQELLLNVLRTEAQFSTIVSIGVMPLTVSRNPHTSGPCWRLLAMTSLHLMLHDSPDAWYLSGWTQISGRYGQNPFGRAHNYLV